MDIRISQLRRRRKACKKMKRKCVTLWKTLGIFLLLLAILCSACGGALFMFDNIAAVGVSFCAFCLICAFLARRSTAGGASGATRQNFDAGLFFSPNSLILIRRKSTPPTVEAPGGFPANVL